MSKEYPGDLQHDALAAWRRFCDCLEALPIEQAEQILRTVRDGGAPTRQAVAPAPHTRTHTHGREAAPGAYPDIVAEHKVFDDMGLLSVVYLFGRQGSGGQESASQESRISAPDP